MKSMTGYGKATVTRGNAELTIELKSVNHRFLDISTKIPRMFIAYEDVVRRVLGEGLSRGHVDVFLNYKPDDNSAKVVTVDSGLAASYVKAANVLAEEFPHLHNDFTLNALMRTPDVLNVEQGEEDEAVLREMLEEALRGAVAKLNEMREIEGNKLRSDLLAKIANIETLLARQGIRAQGCRTVPQQTVRPHYRSTGSGATGRKQTCQRSVLFCGQKLH